MYDFVHTTAHARLFCRPDHPNRVNLRHTERARHAPGNNTSEISQNKRRSLSIHSSHAHNKDDNNDYDAEDGGANDTEERQRPKVNRR